MTQIDLEKVCFAEQLDFETFTWKRNCLFPSQFFRKTGARLNFPSTEVRLDLAKC